MRKFYYARLNDNQICIEVVARVQKLEDVQGYIELPEYNESYYYRKWLGNQWSQETYEPDVDYELLGRIDELETNNANLLNEVSTLNTNINLLEGTIAELTMIMVMLQPNGE